MKVLFAVVNYKTDDALARFAASIELARRHAAGAVEVELLVVDNSLRAEESQPAFVQRLEALLPRVTVVFARSNLGYFGAVPIVQEHAAGREFDTAIVSNSDLVMDIAFFRELATLPRDAAVVAPAILTDEGHGFDQNPKHSARRGALDLRILRLAYSRRLSFIIHQWLGHLRERTRKPAAQSARPATADGTRIYAPHGAIFIFTDVAFFRALPRHEPFLFGEELFVAEEARLRSLPIVYRPAVRVLDTRHASTGSIGSEKRRRMMWESVDFILRRYYRS